MLSENPTLSSAGAPRQVLSLGDAVAIIVGLIIGAGIFKAPSTVSGASGGEIAMVLCWVAGGVLSLIGAMCYAELSTAYPSVGGEYHFIGRAFGRVPAFFYAWARMTVIVAGSIAVFAYVFGDYCSRLLDLGKHSSSIYAVLIVVLLTVVNIVGIKAGKNTQNGGAVPRARRAGWRNAELLRRTHVVGHRSGHDLRALHLRGLERRRLHLSRGARP